jgi:hypothetical protein
MGVLIDFFVVRPVFTLFGLRVLWVAYLFGQAFPVLTVLTNPNVSKPLEAVLLLVFSACLNIAIFRLLIEVAAAILLGRPSSLHPR